MKTIFLLLVVLFAFFGIGFGQTMTRSSATLDPKSRFEQTVGLIDPTKPRLAKSEVVGPSLGNDKIPAFGPGENPVFLLSSNHEFVQPGETLELSLVPMVTTNRTFFGTIQNLKPGYSGDYDGTERVGYCNADTASGGSINGITAMQSIHILSRKFNPEDSYGRNQYNVVITDDNGTLVQQILLDVYLVNAGQYSRWFYIDTTRQTSNGLVLTGNFPVSSPIFYMVSAGDRTGLITGPYPEYAAYASDNGRRLVLSGTVEYTRDTAVTITAWSPGTRQAFVKRDALVQHREQ